MFNWIKALLLSLPRAEQTQRERERERGVRALNRADAERERRERERGVRALNRADAERERERGVCALNRADAERARERGVYARWESKTSRWRGSIDDSQKLGLGAFLKGKKSLKWSAMFLSWQHCASPFLQQGVGPRVKQKIRAALIAR